MRERKEEKRRPGEAEEKKKRRKKHGEEREKQKKLQKKKKRREREKVAEEERRVDGVGNRRSGEGRKNNLDWWWNNGVELGHLSPPQHRLKRMTRSRLKSDVAVEVDAVVVAAVAAVEAQLTRHWREAHFPGSGAGGVLRCRQRESLQGKQLARDWGWKRWSVEKTSFWWRLVSQIRD